MNEDIKNEDFDLCPHGRHIGAVCIPCAEEAGAKPGNLKVDDRPYTNGTLPWPSDEINSPLHYTVGGYEAIDVIRAKLTPEEYIGGLKWQIMKYIMRANYKGHHDADCKKAAWYAEELRQFISDLESATSAEGSDK